ncbi:MAG: hypothetical protein ACLFQI_02580, partial [Halochromatium sp.]|uniref:hypothetical protein n=1 Tax=Halochromatium sp. TaxID=2049430 RepID=UPI00397B5F54
MACFTSRISHVGIEAGFRANSSSASHRCGEQWILVRLRDPPRKRQRRRLRAKRVNQLSPQASRWHKRQRWRLRAKQVKRLSLPVSRRRKRQRQRLR